MARSTARDHLDKAALVIAFLAGASGSWSLKYFGFGPFIAVAWTVAAMLFYVIAVTLLGRLRIEPETIGDNCYYLGFLLTLSSLSATLYQLTQSDEQAELMRSIIAGFGVALISTIFGILLRVIFIQLRPDIVARDRETRIELQQAAREFRLELAFSVAAIKEFTTEAVQLASEQGARIAEATDAAVASQRSRMQSDTEAYVALLHQTLAQAGSDAAATIGTSVAAAAGSAETTIRSSLDTMARAVAAQAAAQTLELDDRAPDAARAAAMATEFEAVASRTAAALHQLGRSLGESAEAAETAVARLRRLEPESTPARTSGIFGSWRS